MSLTRLAVAMGLSFQAVSRRRKDFARGANQGGRRGPELCACPQTGPIHLTSPPARTRGFSTIVQPLFDRLKREPMATQTEFMFYKSILKPKLELRVDTM